MKTVLKFCTMLTFAFYILISVFYIANKTIILLHVLQYVILSHSNIIALIQGMVWSKEELITIYHQPMIEISNDTQ